MASGRSEAERALRRDLAACYRMVALMGWDDLLYTHLSVRIPGPDRHFLLNPFGLLFEEVTASSLVKVDLAGAIVEPSPHPVNSAGFTIHSAVHEAREDAHCVMHLHTVAGTGVSCQGEGLLPLHQEAMLIREQLAYHDYEGVAFDHAERPRLTADLGGKSFMLLRNHGTLTCGPSIATAFQRMYRLERACEMQVAALAGGRPLTVPNQAVRQLTAEQGADDPQPVADAYLWPALLRKLDRMGADYWR
jgi:ribulose-5-phosphate 4-epimerase/fuculose-1-phosphate aldolase